jgi:hypothetical protein
LTERAYGEVPTPPKLDDDVEPGVDNPELDEEVEPEDVEPVLGDPNPELVDELGKEPIEGDPVAGVVTGALPFGVSTPPAAPLGP